MRKFLVLLVAGLLSYSVSWADPGRDESGHGEYNQFDRREFSWHADRESQKRQHELDREAAKAYFEQEREAEKAWAELEREERKHYDLFLTL